jgi:polysaccharide chain length determinant protein (PEP-CTERM system associated)
VEARNNVIARRYTLSEIIHVIARRRWLILVPFAFGVAIVPLLARLAPERYRSEALIVVIPQQVPDNYVKPTVSGSIEERLPSITDQILSRSRLERIIQEMDLYKAERLRGVMEDVVERMRRDVTTTATGKDVDSFRISYVSDHPEKARKVTERLASLYIDQNSKDRENQAENTSEFLATQLAEAKRRLIEQEKKLESYRKSYAGQMPSQLQGNLQAIQNANLQLQSLNESTNRAQERRLLIERQLADARAVPALAASPPASGSDAPAPVSTARQLELAQARLAVFLQRYTSDHPEVVSLERTVAELVTRLETEEASAALTPPELPLTPAEAAQQKRIRDFQAELAVLDYQLAANRSEVSRLKQTVAEYQAKVDAVPTRESELVELTRDYSTMQTAYANLLMKREDSVIAANLERRQIGEQFRLVDAASRPEKPYNQLERLAVMGSGAAAGLVLGLLGVALLEYRNSSFRCAEEVLKALSLPVFASIPVMASDRECLVAKRRRWAVDAGGTALLLAAGAVLVLWRIQS